MESNLQDEILSAWLSIVKGKKPGIYFCDTILD